MMPCPAHLRKAFLSAFSLIAFSLSAQQIPELLIPDGHVAPITRVVLTPDEKNFITVSTDETARMWDFETGAGVRTFEGASGSILISPNGKFLITGAQYIFKPDSLIKIWRIDNGQLIRTLRGQNVIGLSPDGLHVLFYDQVGKSSVVFLSGLLIGQPQAVLTVDSITAAACTEDFSMLAVGYEDGTVEVYNLKTQALQLTYREHSEVIRQIAFTADQRFIVTGSGDRLIKIYDRQKEAVTRSIWANFNKAFSLDPHGKYIYSSSYDNTIESFEFESGEWVKLFDKNSYSIGAMALTQDGRFLVEACTDKKIKILDLQSGQTKEIGARSLFVSHLTTSEDDKFLIASSFDNQIRIWNLETGALQRSVYSQYVMQTYLCDSLNLLASISAGPSVELKRFDNGESVKMFANHETLCYAMALNKTKTRLATGGYDHQIHVWSNPGGVCQGTYLGHGGNIMALCFSSDDRWLVSSAFDGNVKVWNVDRQVEKYSLKCGLINQLIVSPDDRFLIGAGQDGSIKIWNFENGILLKEIKAHSRPIGSIAMQGDLLVTASEDQTLKVWKWRDGALVSTLRGHTSMLNYVVFAKQGRWIISAGHDGSIKIWDTESGQIIATMMGLKNGEWMTCSKDGHYTCSPGGDLNAFWRFNNTVYSMRQFSEVCKDEDYIKQIFSSPSFMPQNEFAITVPPAVEIVRPYRAWSVNNGAVDFEVAAKADDEDLVLQVYVNDQLMESRRESKVKEIFTKMSVKLREGYNQIIVKGSNAKGLKSQDSKLYIYYDGM